MITEQLITVKTKKNVCKVLRNQNKDSRLQCKKQRIIKKPQKTSILKKPQFFSMFLFKIVLYSVCAVVKRSKQNLSKLVILDSHSIIGKSGDGFFYRKKTKTKIKNKLFESFFCNFFSEFSKFFGTKTGQKFSKKLLKFHGLSFFL